MRRRPILITVIAAAAAVGLAVGAWAVATSTTEDASGTSAPHPVASPGATPDATAAMPPMTLTADTRYVALGDSFGAGAGTGDEKGACFRSPDFSYAALFATGTGVHLVHNVACSGATTADLLANQLSALNDDVDLVTVSIGGNDLGGIELANACSAGEKSNCQTDFTAALGTLKTLTATLSDTYAAIAKAAPNARIVVTGYPLLFELPATDSPEFASIAAVNTATAALDADLRAAVADQQKRGVQIWYVDVDFAGHALGSSTSWLNASGPAAFHPTKVGYQEYARVLTAAFAGS